MFKKKKGLKLLVYNFVNYTSVKKTHYGDGCTVQNTLEITDLCALNRCITRHTNYISTKTMTKNKTKVAQGCGDRAGPRPCRVSQSAQADKTAAARRAEVQQAYPGSPSPLAPVASQCPQAKGGGAPRPRVGTGPSPSLLKTRAPTRAPSLRDEEVKHDHDSHLTAVETGAPGDGAMATERHS